MAPDLNSLPQSPAPTSSEPSNQARLVMAMPTEPTNINTPPSPHSPSLSSLQAAASINAGIRNSPDRNSPSFERRRSSLMMNIQHNDPSIPGPGEMLHGTGSPNLHARGSLPEYPQHHRAPSLGEIHQQLESEQEAQVNRLLQMIRSQQEQINALQAASASPPSEASHHAPQSAEAGASASAVVDDTTRSRTSSVGVPLNTMHQQTLLPRSPRQRPISLSRQSSARMSVSGAATGTGTGTSGPRSSSQSPMLRPLSTNYDPHREDWLLGGARDESAFYQAETQMLTRENQMLKQRIRELERQLNEASASPSAHAGSASHVPTAISPLASPPALPDTQPLL